MNRQEVLRYMRTNSTVTDEKILALVDRACSDIENASEPKTLYRLFDCTVKENCVKIGDCEFLSTHLAKNLYGCKKVAVFGATLGTAVDRLIKAAAATDVSLAMAYQAAAAAKIEEVCDNLENDIKLQLGVTLRQRFSPGYFDLDIKEQKKLFTLLELTKRIGLTLTSTFEMLPTKSVTAFIGVDDKNDKVF